jgi:outer membrane protein OmpA-like peptidoglycan-associated protein
MRGRVLAIVIVALAAVLVIAGWRLKASQQDVVQTPSASATPLLSETPSVPPSSEPGDGSDVVASPESDESASPDAPSPSDTSLSAAMTPAPEPTGLQPGWEQQAERTVGGPEADLLVRAGDINNLGFGWPPGFTPFSGQSTPVHDYPCDPRPGDAPGTDHVMLGSAVTAKDLQTRTGDGYANCSSRPNNLPQAIPLVVGALPRTVHVVLLQMFLDDFQAPIWNSHFQVSLNGTRIPSFEDTVNALDQTGPIGKLVTLRLLPEYVPILRAGTVNLLIDDPTTHALDGYAIDFVRILVNPRAFRYNVTIACRVVDAANLKPIAAASVSSAQVTASTGSDGRCILRGVPAGMASVAASAVGYDSAVQLLDLPAGSHATANFALRRHRENAAELQRLIQRNGSVAIYGIHFDTASAKLRPDSLPSLETVRELVQSKAGSRWIIAGHTDNQGGAAYNLNLSIARAKSVVTWLTQHGIAGNRLVAQGYGLTRPVADNATVSGRALNRRVEVKPAP